MKVTNADSNLVMEHLMFDNIHFKRLGCFNTNSVFDPSIEVTIRANDHLDLYKITLELEGEKEKEYKLKIALTGFFSYSTITEIDPELRDEMIHKNAVAIMLPYLRSQVSIMTAQPEVDCVVLPPFSLEDTRKISN